MNDSHLRVLDERWMWALIEAAGGEVRIYPNDLRMVRGRVTRIDHPDGSITFSTKDPDDAGSPGR